ncbi:unnamed protein product [Symbiodinium natans]|uniref:ORC1/DEAH AAA+ ATPase domain-containing protein n=1 Tax=Symbiodinium natans TaxID=878477 RepID=A0A812HBB8_9DINO|nr:unnamed protein product [Symbiodinium natans]
MAVYMFVLIVLSGAGRPVSAFILSLTRNPDEVYRPQDFQLGVVVGESGSGVTSLLCRLAQHGHEEGSVELLSDQAVASLFEDATETLPMVGLNNIPAWCRPYHCLSNGQQCRVRLALQLRSNAVIDDFGSGVDVREIHSMANAISKRVRRSNLRRVLIGTHCTTCISFFQPDFVVQSNGSVSWNPNPPIAREVRVHLAAGFMGKELAKPGETGSAGRAFSATEAAVWPRALRVRREVKSTQVQLDKRTLDAAAAFEFPFEGKAECLIPVLPEKSLESIAWSIGLVIGPSGTGKTTTIRKLCEAHEDLTLRSTDEVEPEPAKSAWELGKALMSEEDLRECLQACQLPEESWHRQCSCLSRSEAWRLRIALCLQQCRNADRQLLVVDEFTTQLDRAHALRLCRSLASYLRAYKLRAVLATVHTDVTPLLRPEWVFDTGNAEFAANLGDPEWDKWTIPSPPSEDIDWGVPELTLKVHLVEHSSVQTVWKRHFKDHHYLAGSLAGLQNLAFIALHEGAMAAFHASSMQPGRKTFVREHRLVVRPEFQGFGIGPRLSDFMAQRWLDSKSHSTSGFMSKTAHPRLGECRQRSQLWRPLRSNLQVSLGSEFGKMGFAGQKREIITLAHGTQLQVRKVPPGFCITVRWPTRMITLNQELLRRSKTSLRDQLPFRLEGRLGRLVLKSVVPGFLLPEGVMLERGWALAEMNGEPVKTVQQLSKLLRTWAHIESAGLCPIGRQPRTPQRSSQEEAAKDLLLLQTRLACNATLDDEICQVRRLCQELVQAQKSAADGIMRPNISEVRLQILPELEVLLGKRFMAVERKDRICYSHQFVGHVAPRESKWERSEQYQAWMRLRMAELKSEGRTHGQALEEAKLEFDRGSVVVRVPIDQLAACAAPDVEKDQIADVLGMTLDSSLQLLTVKEGGRVAFCGVPLDPTQNVWAVTALRRGETKQTIQDLDAFVACIKSLVGAPNTGANSLDLWIYLCRRQRRGGRRASIAQATQALPAPP